MRRTSLALALAVLAFPTLAQAECGWLLMAPRAFGLQAAQQPVAKWDQVAAYDSAAACEEGKSNNFERVTRGRPMSTKEERRERNDWATWANSARCLPASQVPVR